MKQLFKYLREPRDLFSNGFIRLSQLSALNDPFEASFCSDSLDELSEYFDYSKTFSSSSESGEISFSDYVKEMVSNIGIISLTENKENLLMWAHYANEHKGLIAGIVHFEEQTSIFHNLLKPNSLISSSSTDEWSPFDGTPKPVNYRKGVRYRNDKFDYDYSNISAEGADRILYEVFMQKSDEWIYEQEYRVVLRLEQADRIIIPNISMIDNQNIRRLIIDSSCYYIDNKTGHCIINLYEFDDDTLRVIIANNLSKLSFNPNVIYLMKLSSRALNCCLFGLRTTLSKQDLQTEHAISTGYFDVWRAKKDDNYYSLNFEKI